MASMAMNVRVLRAIIWEPLSDNGQQYRVHAVVGVQGRPGRCRPLENPRREGPLGFKAAVNAFWTWWDSLDRHQVMDPLAGDRRSSMIRTVIPARVKCVES